ncbi:GAF domain-containing protein [Paenibacillus sp. PR3]|uniref:GAF domain-containing protein n=1 Tax=Paenibacillus terricola TaxID=2763503 RepID=A0ABR8MYU8_9BACL|nr:GAF domain-containing protein [Paenibacillus terricola]MBD3921129.1 GAF domain-containing protein [Paenibacillus terricola]
MNGGYTFAASDMQADRWREETGSDFAGIAKLDEEGKLRWAGLSGITSTRTAQLTFKGARGDGFIATAIRSGRPAAYNGRAAAGSAIRARSEPLLLAESLLAAIALPYLDRTGQLTGLLIVGRRSAVPYSESDIANALASFCQNGL